MDKPRALVVDDDAMILRATSRVLRNFAEVVPCLGAQIALEKLSMGEKFDVILSDISMPDVTGKDFYERAVAQDPSLADKFIFLTGGASAPELQQFIEQAPRVLTKPVSVVELMHMIQRVTGRAP